MELLAVYDDQAEAEEAKSKIKGPLRLASDRDDNEIIWRLFGEATWGNFYALDMYRLVELKQLLDQRKAGGDYDRDNHKEILQSLNFVVNTFKLEVPKHWL